MRALPIIKVARAIRRLSFVVMPGCNADVAVKFLEEARALIEEAVREIRPAGVESGEGI